MSLAKTYRLDHPSDKKNPRENGVCSSLPDHESIQTFYLSVLQNITIQQEYGEGLPNGVDFLNIQGNPYMKIP